MSKKRTFAALPRSSWECLTILLPRGGRGLRGEAIVCVVTPVFAQKIKGGQMGSSKTRLKTIRIRNKCADFFEDRPLNYYVEWLYESIELGDIIEGEWGLEIGREISLRGLKMACKRTGDKPKDVIERVTMELNRKADEEEKAYWGVYMDDENTGFIQKGQKRGKK